mgnify:CR=1 FL=1
MATPRCVVPSKLPTLKSANHRRRVAWRAAALLALGLSLAALITQAFTGETRFVLAGSVEGDFNVTLTMVNDTCGGASNALLARPSTAPHPAGSPWWTWPLVLKPVYWYLGQPGGNATGVNMFITAVEAKRLGLLHELDQLRVGRRHPRAVVGERVAVVAAVGGVAVDEERGVPAVEEALFIMMQSYDRLGLNQLRDDTRRILEKNYPNSALIYPQNASKKPWWKLW